ncbi:unnamed protein product [Cyprideis torosa]|nr:unnamed protein product [Cyprideis torosa]CAG0891852.1 unnamed protein product [Cyprideis torosa]
MTAAAFAKGLLALEGELTPILVQMVKSANTNGLLDNDADASKYQSQAKKRLFSLLRMNRSLTEDDRVQINPTRELSVEAALDLIGNPVETCRSIHSMMQELVELIDVKFKDGKVKDTSLYHGETWDLMSRRWGKLAKDFVGKSGEFDISKIPDIYDCIKYDLQHNQHVLRFSKALELHRLAKAMADIVIPQEYGLTSQEKLAIGQSICTPLLKKLRTDLNRSDGEAGCGLTEEEVGETVNRLHPHYSRGVSSPGRLVRTRLYFTSESHIHSLMSVLRYGGLLDAVTDEQWGRATEYVSAVSELSYLSQIIIMLYEDPAKDIMSDQRYVKPEGRVLLNFTGCIPRLGQDSGGDIQTMECHQIWHSFIYVSRKCQIFAIHDRYHIELHFSPGVNCCIDKEMSPRGQGYRPQSSAESRLNTSTNNSVAQSESNSPTPPGSAPSSGGKSMDASNSNPALMNLPIPPSSSQQPSPTSTSSGVGLHKVDSYHSNNGTSSSESSYVSTTQTTPPRTRHPLEKELDDASRLIRLHSPTPQPDDDGDSQREGGDSDTPLLPLSDDNGLCGNNGFYGSHYSSNYYTHPPPCCKLILPYRRTVSELTSALAAGLHVENPGEEGLRAQRHSVSSSPTGQRGSAQSMPLHHSCYSTLHHSLLPLFSTAVISGSVPPAVGSPPESADGPLTVGPCGGVPGLRPLETLHNALSLNHLGSFIDKVTRSSTPKGSVSGLGSLLLGLPSPS